MMKRGCLGGLAVLFAIFYFGYWGLMHWDNSRMIGRATFKLSQIEGQRSYREAEVKLRDDIKEMQASIDRSAFWGADVPIAIGVIGGLFFFLRRRTGG